MLMIVFRTLRLVDSRTAVMAVLPWPTKKITERDAPCSQFDMTGHLVGTVAVSIVWGPKTLNRW